MSLFCSVSKILCLISQNLKTSRDCDHAHLRDNVNDTPAPVDVRRMMAERRQHIPIIYGKNFQVYNPNGAIVLNFGMRSSAT